MNREIEDFLKENPPRYQLKEHSDDILYLLKKGCTQTQVLKFLKEKRNVECTRQTLSKQIKYLKKNSSREEIENIKKSENSLSTKENKNESNKGLSKKEFLKKVIES